MKRLRVGSSVSKNELGREEIEGGVNIKYIQHIIPNDHIYWNYFILFSSSVLSNMSGGSFPAIVDDLQRELKIEEGTLGLLATMHYLGALLGGFVLLFVINLNYRKSLVVISMLGNTLCSLAVSISKGITTLFIARFFTGFFVVLFAIFNPVWIDQFTPNNAKSVIMSFHHLESILGTILGFFLTSRIAMFISWRYSWLIQAMLLGVFFFIVILMSNIVFSRTMQRVKNTEVFIMTEIESNQFQEESTGLEEGKGASSKQERLHPLNGEAGKTTVGKTGKTLEQRQKGFSGEEVASDRPQDGGLPGAEGGNGPSGVLGGPDADVDNRSVSVNSKMNEGKPDYTIFQTFCLLIKNPLYVLQVLAITSLLFIITVIQQWMKHYLIFVIKIDENTADILFIIFCVTSPPCGVLFGGFFVQKVGGYSHINAMYYICFNAFTCFVLAIIVFFVTNFVLFSVLMWLFLFFGAAIVPSLGGSILSALPLALKGSGYSLQNVTANILGLAPAPTVYGFVYEHTKSTAPTFALSLCLSFSCIGFVTMFAATYVRKYELYKPQEDSPPEVIIEKALQTQPDLSDERGEWEKSRSHRSWRSFGRDKKDGRENRSVSKESKGSRLGKECGV